MKLATNRFVGLVLFVALLVGAPLLSAKDKHKDKICRDRMGTAMIVVAPPFRSGTHMAPHFWR